MRKLLSIGMLLVAATVLAGARNEDFEAARKLSREKNLPMMLDFTGSDWCYWCKLMDKQVFAEKEWETWAATNVVCVTLNFPRNESEQSPKLKAQNEALLRKYGVRGFPTFVLLAPGGDKEIGRAHCPGRDVTPGRFIAEVQKVIGKNASSAK
ncbi:MAG: thioredoxin family protein [Kiritimatiellia bacterium]